MAILVVRNPWLQMNTSLFGHRTPSRQTHEASPGSGATHNNGGSQNRPMRWFSQQRVRATSVEGYLALPTAFPTTTSCHRIGRR